MPDEVLLVVLVVMAIGVGWKWAKNRIDEKKWRETSLTRKFFIALIALLLMVLFWIGAMFIRYLGQSLR
jgi:ACR3 family arsenite efflux pump ArsB